MNRADSQDDSADPAQLGVPPVPVPFTRWPQEWELSYTAFHAGVCKDYLDFAYHQLGSDADAEEAVDATFDKLADKWGQMLRMDNLRGYAWTVLKNRIIDQVRARKRRGIPMEFAAFEAVLPGADPFQTLTEAMAAYQEIRRLPERQRDVIVLCHCLGHTTEEAADLMGVEAATVRSHMSQARRRLAARLGGDEKADDDTTRGERKP